MVHTTPTQSHQNRLVVALNPASSQHAGQKAKRVLIAHFDEVGPLFFDDSAKLGTVRQRIEMRQEKTIRGIDKRGSWICDRVDPGEFTYGLDRNCRAGDHHTEFTI